MDCIIFLGRKLKRKRKKRLESPKERKNLAQTPSSSSEERDLCLPQATPGAPPEVRPKSFATPFGLPSSS